jgi:uncharacterized protein
MRRYRHVKIVFIRHTNRAEEVDEDTFFHGPASGGTLVFRALQAMHEIARSRFRPADWNIYAAQASDGDNSISDGEVAGRLLTDDTAGQLVLCLPGSRRDQWQHVR